MNNVQTEQRQWFNHLISLGSENAIAVLPEALSLPSRKQEAWKYTDLSRLYQQMFKPPGEPFTALQEGDIEHWVYDRQSAYRVVLINGRFNTALSRLPYSEGVSLQSLAELDASSRIRLTKQLADTHEFQHDAFDQLNQALASDGFILQIKANTCLDHPVEVVHLNLSQHDEIVASARSMIIVENGASATVVERYTSTGDSIYFSNNLTRVVLEDNATLAHHRLQQESMQSYHLDRVYLSQHRSSHYQGLNIATGGLWSRSETIVNLDGEAAECDLKGLYTLSDGQYNDMHIDVRHLKPHGRSTEYFKGVLAGKGRAVFDGRILVEQDAQKTDAQLSNDNLLLTDSAEIDTKPQLEIYADDVKCSHGTTVGQIDSNQLFYCRARGLSEQQAIQLLSLGFAEQVVSDIDDVELSEFVKRQILSILGGSGTDV